MCSQDILDKYVFAEKKLHMSMSEAECLSRILAKKISETYSESFDGNTVVVGIANGGLMVAKVVADSLNLQFKTLKIRRKNSRVKRFLGKFRCVVKACSLILATPVLSTITRSLINSMNKIEVADCFGGSFGGKKILLIDDCVETGASLRVAEEILRNEGASVIAIGVLTFKNIESCKEISVEKLPIVYLNTRIMHYPWSQNNEQYVHFLEWLKYREVQIWE